MERRSAVYDDAPYGEEGPPHLALLLFSMFIAAMIAIVVAPFWVIASIRKCLSSLVAK